MTFADLGLNEPILRAVAAEGYTVPTPIQTRAIPYVLAGRDVLGCAQTGSGKTAAFSLPIIQRLTAAASPMAAPTGRKTAPRALILCPTRELAAQIGESFRVYGRGTGIRFTTIFGGVNQHHQVKALERGIEVLIATPGRLMDLHAQGHVNLSNVEILVLDEADRMLDMGFVVDIRRIVKLLPATRQSLLFSATMPTDIRRLAESFMVNPVRVHADVRHGDDVSWKHIPERAAIPAISQSVYRVSKAAKTPLLEHLLRGPASGRVIVFTRTKHGADRVVKGLTRAGIHAAALHGDKSQQHRTRVLASFKGEQPPVLIATDIASRGIDVENISHVINFDVPNTPETYVHRVGRTGRAGATGAAVTFCDSTERGEWRAIQKHLGQAVNVEECEVPQNLRIDAGELRHAEHHASSRPGRDSSGASAPKQPQRSKQQRRNVPKVRTHSAHNAAPVGAGPSTEGQRQRSPGATGHRGWRPTSRRRRSM